MEIQGKVIQLLALQTGEGKNGVWKKQDVVVETKSQYPKKVCLSFWGDKINPSLLVVGADLKISFDAESREYNGRWYTELRAWKVDPLNAGDAPINNSGSDNFIPEPPASGGDDLPF